jgi:GntR family transcriptional regulator
MTPWEWCQVVEENQASQRAVAERLRRRLLEDINAGVLPPGTRLGNERDLAEQCGVSRSTLRRVLAELEQAGLVRRVRGRTGGTFVTHSKVDRDLSAVVGVPALLARQGYAAGTRVLSTEISRADDPTRVVLALSDNADLVVNIRRIRLADGSPISLEHAILPADRFPGILELPLGGSLYELFDQQYDVRPAEAEERIEVVHATDDEAALLAVVATTPLLAITRLTVDEQGRPFERSYELFRADRTRITVRSPGRGLHRRALGEGADFVELTSAVH